MFHERLVKSTAAPREMLAVEKVAVTSLAAFIATVHEVPTPLHAPPHPENVDPEAGVAVRVTPVPPATDALQVAPQLIQFGDEVTVPPPLPDLLTVSAKVVGGMVVGTEVVDGVG